MGTSKSRGTGGRLTQIERARGKPNPVKPSGRKDAGGHVVPRVQMSRAPNAKGVR
jgi:hypothetical protein